MGTIDNFKLHKIVTTAEQIYIHFTVSPEDAVKAAKKFWEYIESIGDINILSGGTDNERVD